MLKTPVAKGDEDSFALWLGQSSSIAADLHLFLQGTAGRMTESEMKERALKEKIIAMRKSSMSSATKPKMDAV